MKLMASRVELGKFYISQPLMFFCRSLYLVTFLILCSSVVEFKDKEAAAKALDVMHRYEIKGRKIVVREVSCGIIKL